MHQLSWNTRLAVGALVAISVLMALLSGCTSAQVSSAFNGLVKTCYNGKCLTYKTWGKKIDAAINGKAVGYAYVILHNGVQTQAINAFGQARTAADPPVTGMSFDEPFNIASVTKTLTAAAVLRLLAAQQINVHSSIAPYLPPSWPLGQGVSAITFAQLLTHTSGIQLPPNDTDGISYTDLKALMGQNIDLSPTGYKQRCINSYNQGMFVTCYQNTNFALFRIIIPYILGSANPVPLDHSPFSPPFLDPANDDATAQDYLSYMNSVYGSSFPISCTPQEDSFGFPSSSQMLDYLYPGTISRLDEGDWEHICGAGGIQLSVDQMAAFLSNLRSGDYIATTSSSDPYDPSSTTLFAMVKYMYGWDYQYSNAYGTCIAKNGGLGVFIGPKNTIFLPYLTTLIVYCPQTGLAFAGLANSALGLSQTSWDNIVQKAYNESWQ
jgi:CubicO group peptidase (beta-lactamase class C family)